MRHRSRVVPFLAAFAAALVIAAPESGAAPSASFTGVAPSRLLDTRAGFTTVDGIAAGAGIRVAGSVTTVLVAGRAGVPADASAAALNITVTEPSTAGFVTVFPCGSIPSTSSVNFIAGQTISNSAIAALDATGHVCLFTSTATQLVVDVNGWFGSGAFIGVGPHRMMDTRIGFTTFDGQFSGAGGHSAGAVTALQVAGRGGVPTDASAVVLNVTVEVPLRDGFVTVYPCGDRPLASTLNHAQGQTIANSTMTQLDASGRVCLFTSATTHLIVDVTGYVPSGALYHPLVPARLVDSRFDGITVDGRCDRTGRPQGGSTMNVAVLGRGGVPSSGVGAVLLNVTTTDPGASGFVSAFTTGASRPNASTVNFEAGGTIANGVIASVDTEGRVALYVSTGVHVVVDVVGWFPGSASAPAPAGCTGRYVAPVSDLPTLSLTAATACAVKIDGAVWCWQMGGNTQDIGAAAPVAGLSSAVQVATGIDTCARRGNGSVACSQYAFVPPGYTTREIPLPSAAVDVAVSWRLDCALTATAEVLCWSGTSAASVIPGIANPIEFLATTSVATVPVGGVVSVNRVAVRTASGVATITMPETGGSYSVSLSSEAAPGVPWSAVVTSRFSPVDPINANCLIRVGGAASCESSGDLAGGREVVQNTGLFLVSGNGDLATITRDRFGRAVGTSPWSRIRDIVGIAHSAVVPSMMTCALTAQGDVTCWTAATSRLMLSDVLVP